MDTDCGLYRSLGYYFLIMSAAWVLIMVWWCSAAYGWSRSHSRPLHRLAVFVVFFKLLYDIFTACILFTCPFKGDKTEYISLAISSSFTLFYTFLYTLFLLLSKGYCVTRYVLIRSEVTVVAILMGAVYLGYSAYTIQPNELFPLLCCLILAVFCVIGKYGLLTVKSLKRQISSLERSGIQDLIRPARRKLRMMSVFTGCFVFYFFIELVSIIVEISAEAAANSILAFMTFIIEETCETGILLVLLWTFRPKFHGELSTIPLLDSGSEVHPIPPLLTFKITHEDLTSISTLPDTAPVLVLPAALPTPEEPFQGIEIGQVLRPPQRL